MIERLPDIIINEGVPTFNRLPHDNIIANECTRYKYLRCISDYENDDCAENRLSFHYFDISANFKINEDCIVNPNSHLVFMVTSEEYDIYLKSALSYEIKKKYGDKSDFTQIWNYDEVYTNLDNAVGIFGAKFYKKVLWNTGYEYIDLYIAKPNSKFGDNYFFDMINKKYIKLDPPE